jgi:hypothetical protein
VIQVCSGVTRSRTERRVSLAVGSVTLARRQ